MRTLALCVISIFCLFSCVPYKEVRLLQDLKGNEESFKQSKFQYKLRASDQLYVQIKTFDKELNELLRSDAGGGGNMMQQQQNLGGGASLLTPQFYLISYSINEDGDVNLPYIGLVNVAGMSIDEASKAIQESVNAKLNGTTVNVKLMSYKITVHGEVARQGLVTVFNNQANIFEVLGLAGGITEFGDRKNIQVIRSIDEEATVFRIDLTKTQALNSEAYQLLPNDIVVVNPLKAKTQRLNLPLIGTISSVLTTILVIANFATR